MQHKLVSLSFALAASAVLLVGCGSDDADTDVGAQPIEATTSTVATGCVGEDWQTIDVDAFTFRLPPGVLDQEVQGIDSLVGRYEGTGLTVAFDHGWYSSDFGDLAELGATQTSISLDDHDARLVVAGPDATATFETDHVTALHAAVSTDELDQETTLAMWVGYDDADLADTAECIVRSVDFA